MIFFRNTVHISGYVDHHFEHGRSRLHSRGWRAAQRHVRPKKHSLLLPIMLRYETRRYDFMMMLAICFDMANVHIYDRYPPPASDEFSGVTDTVRPNLHLLLYTLQSVMLRISDHQHYDD